MQLAKFLAVYHLRAENVVDDISELTFRQLQSGKISVLFKGNLRQSFSNELGTVTVKGTVTQRV
ncbi:hypothetical protein HNQ10_002664 [Deinococcus metallilatus]|uniref:Uncharacterized protein n=1 Tax=Deinococcus metallilatus TaxID=1211322 RepID=A0ABR6MWR5_9DEIO|nr:hypothetical protein [Deinococcus metallilatus]